MNHGNVKLARLINNTIMTPLEALQAHMSPYAYAGLKKTEEAEKYIYPVPELLDRISKRLNVSVTDMRSKNRKRDVVVARQIAVAYLHLNTKMTLKQIGLIFGQDHTSVLHSTDIVRHSIKHQTDIGLVYNSIFQ